MTEHHTPLITIIQAAIETGATSAEVLKAARAQVPGVSTEEVFRLADSLADLGLVDRRLAPPTASMGRREMLKSLLAGTAAAGLAMAATRSAVAQADDTVLEVCEPEQAEFRAREENLKRRNLDRLRDRAQESETKAVYRQREQARKMPATATEERQKYQVQAAEENDKGRKVGREQYQKSASTEKDRKKQTTQYLLTGPAPVWIEIDGAEKLTGEVELSSIVASGDGCSSIRMDLMLSGFDANLQVREQIAVLQQRLGKEVAVTWGPFADEAYEGFVDDVQVSYTGYDEFGNKNAARVRLRLIEG